MGLDEDAVHVVFMADGAGIVVVLCKEFSDCASEVPEELFGGLRAFYYHSGGGGQPGQKVVSAAYSKFCRKAFRPGLGAGFVTVYQQILYPVLAEKAAGGILVHIEVGMQIAGECILVEFVHFQPGGLHGGRMILLAGKRSAEAVHHPAALRRCPAQYSVLHLVADVDYFGWLGVRR